jgi:tripartite-type tricarboxylate transporter receptor subunit TctC
VDAVGRILAEPLTQALGQPVIVENRAGAGGAIGVDSVAKALPDGYAFSMVSAGNMTAGPVVRRTPYDPITLGFVTMVCHSPLLLVARNTLEARDLAAFVALVRRQPDLIRFASGGVGTATHLAGELMNLRLGTRMLHIPYRGTAPALTDIVAGNADIFFSDSSAWPMVQQGQMRLLGVTSAAPWATSPDTPPINRLVPDFDISNWYGMIAPPRLLGFWRALRCAKCSAASALNLPPWRQRHSAPLCGVKQKPGVPWSRPPISRRNNPLSLKRKR